MVTKKNVYDNENIRILSQLANYSVLEHVKDLSVNPMTSTSAYFSSRMNVRKRQLAIELNEQSVMIQSGAMQWTSGNVSMQSGVKGIGGFLGKKIAGAVTGESGIRPIYQGSGSVVLEPTYRHILLINVSDWGSIVLDDGLFLACDTSVSTKVVARQNVSSAVFGREGLFNLCLSGVGTAALESPVPAQELIAFSLQDDVLKIDGNMAVAWSGSLEFTVEKSGKSLLGSAVSGEGLVNVYRGTGTVLMAPTAKENYFTANPMDSDSNKSPSQSKMDKISTVTETLGNIADFLK